MCVRDYNKTFLFPSFEFFCTNMQQKLVGKIFFFLNKTKTETVLEKRGRTFLDIE